MADEVDVDDERHDAKQQDEHGRQDERGQQDGHGKDEESGEQRGEKKRERGRDAGSDGLAIAAAVILAAQLGRGGHRGVRLPPLGRPGDTRVRTTSGDGWWCW